MSAQALNLVRGAAVVIDDRIGQESDVDDLLGQLRDAAIPTVELKALPPPESVVHWRQFALIVMDWALTDAGDSKIDLPGGLALPSTLAQEGVLRNVEFIAALLGGTALPIFVATNEDVDTVESSLAEGLADKFPGYGERVHVFKKFELKPNLLETIGNWIASRPVLKVLDTWRQAYLTAEISVFHQFSEAQHDWVESIQRAAQADGADVRVMLRDLIASNVVNRIGPLNVLLSDAPADGTLTDATALRRVLHYSAVVPDSSLASCEISTGDLFVNTNAAEPYEEIRILLTPECDLTLRDQSWRFTTLTATRDPKLTKTAANRAKGAWKASSRELHLTVNLLTEDCAEYDVSLNDWSSELVTPIRSDDSFVAWPGFRRIGRLLSPYSTYLQQNLAAVAVRKGTPRLPADLYAAVVDGSTH